MPRFRVGQTHETNRPVITVDAGLTPGRYVFQLVVVDNAGQDSEPDTLVVTVTRGGDPFGPQGITEPPAPVRRPRAPRQPAPPDSPRPPRQPRRPRGGGGGGEER